MEMSAGGTRAIPMIYPQFGNPLARVYSRREARELFKDFSEVKLRTYFLNKRFLPVIGSLLPRSIESQLAARWGWHLWIYAEK